ncbi:MAG: MvdC/MvdD family ATP grasp protein, partial [Pseudonocardiaceae bacterium]
MILILTSDNDLTADRVVTEIARRGEAVSRLDTADFPCSITVNAVLQDELGWHGWVETEHGQIQVNKIQSVYYRRPTGFLFPVDVTGSD